MDKEFKEYIIQEYEDTQKKIVSLDYDLFDDDMEFMFYQGRLSMLFDIMDKFNIEF